jgi:hypothetical protein
MATTASSPQPDPIFAANAIARAERRRAMLERLAVLGMALAEEIVQRTVDSSHHPERVQEPGRDFAQVSRAARPTLVLEGGTGPKTVALRNDNALAVDATRVDPRPTETEGDTRLALQFRAAVETICFDLGLDPDWSRWPETEDAAFVPIIPMLTALLATETAPLVPGEGGRAVMEQAIADPVAPERRPPPGT